MFLGFSGFGVLCFLDLVSLGLMALLRFCVFVLSRFRVFGV